MKTEEFDIILSADFEALKEFELIELKGGKNREWDASGGMCNVDNFNGNCVSGCACK